jgi:hypothetical protein
MYKLCFFVPVSYAEKVKAAVFLTGAGRIGLYDSCSWETLGIGQFRARSGSRPFIGEQGRIETVEELKVELVCQDELVQDAVAAMKAAHPYEEPAYDVYRLEVF